MELTQQQKYEVIEDWIKKLRSGEYKQTKRSLKDCNGHCCLGVFMESVNEKFNIGTWTLFNGRFMFEQLNLEGNKLIDIAWIPPNIKEIFGFDSSFVDISYKGEQTYLSSLNDSYDLSFAEIADLVEEQILPKYKE